MSHSFKVGDRVVVIASYDAHTVGAVSTVTSVRSLAATERDWIRSDGSAATVPIGATLVGVDGASLGFGRIAYYHQENLAPLPDDGHLAGEWTEELRRLCKPKVTA